MNNIGDKVIEIIAKTLVGIAIVIVVTLTISLNACFNPADVNAIEVIFNKNGIDYNLTMLIEKYKPIVVDEGRIYVFKYIYRTSIDRDLEFGVTVYLEKLCRNAPCIEGYNEEEPVRDVIAIRLESLEQCLLNSTTNVGECPVKSIINLAFLELIKRLTDEGILMGLDIKDIYAIMDGITSNYFTAGWNNRLLYNEELDKWLPYAELVNRGLVKGVLLKGYSCSYKLPREVIDEIKALEPTLIIEKQTETITEITPSVITPQPPPSITSISITTSSPQPPPSITSISITQVTPSVTKQTETQITQVQQLDGVAVGIAISIGIIVALAIYISWGYLSKT